MCPRINIEDKHTYFTTPQRELITSVYQTGNTVNFSPSIVHNTPNYPISGVDQSDRIGRKIYTTSLMSEGYIRLNNTVRSNANPMNASITVPFWRAFYGIERAETSGDYQFPVPGYVGDKSYRMALDSDDGSYIYNPLQEDFNISIRHFVVEFKNVAVSQLTEVELQTYLKDWYSQLVIQTTDNVPASNSMQILRESTAYTGQFRILYDKTHHLTRSNPVLHYSYTIPYKRNLNFDSLGGDVPTENVIFELFIPAINNTIDFGNFGFGQYLYDWKANNGTINTINISQGFINSTLKLKYMDV